LHGGISARPSTVTAGRDRIIGTLIGAAVGAVAILGREHGLPKLPLYVVGLVPLVLLTAAWQSLRLSCITFTIVLLAPAAGSSFALPMIRVIEIVIGTLAALEPDGSPCRPVQRPPFQRASITRAVKVAGQALTRARNPDQIVCDLPESV
jgi:Fusaric acid resistance protein-like